MRYIQSFLFYFFVIFFADYLIPGVDVVDQTKIPQIRGDLIFAGVLGLLNSLILPFLRIFSKPPGFLHLAIATTVLNFAAFGLLKLITIGVFVTDISGYLIVSFCVTFGSFLLSLARRNPKSARGHEAVSSDETPQEESHPPQS